MSQINLVYQSLRPPGYVPETYRGRKPARLTAERLAGLRRFVERVRLAADVPGLAVALFSRDRIFIEEGFGVRERGRAERVTPNTLFLIASNTKPLTTLLLARLVDAGKFRWGSPVISVYPKFRLGDDNTTRRVLIKHLVCACTGLPRQDFEWLFTAGRSSPEAQFHVLASMKPTTEFGALFQYSNPLASAAGYVAARSVHPQGDLGKAYDQAMLEYVFRPLGMLNTTFSFAEAKRRDHASPHSENLELKNVVASWKLNYSIIPVRPAGGAWSSVRDLMRYVRVELANGQLPDGSRFVSKTNLLARRQPQVRVSEKVWYAMGLMLESIKGIRVIRHGGSMPGYKSNFFFLPAIGLGGVILANADTGWALHRAILRRVLEVIYGGKAEAEEDLRSNIRLRRNYLRGQQKHWKFPPAPDAVKRLGGGYHNPVLGKFIVRRRARNLWFEFPGWRSRMATRRNPDGTNSFVTVSPGMRGIAFSAPAGKGQFRTLVVRTPQQVYRFRLVQP